MVFSIYQPYPRGMIVFKINVQLISNSVSWYMAKYEELLVYKMQINII